MNGIIGKYHNEAFGDIWDDMRCYKYGTLTDIFYAFPKQIIGDGNNVSSYTIKGNMTYNGTPTPTNPIYPQECGDRTNNLYNSADTTWILGILDDNGQNTGASTSHYTGNFTEVNANKTYVIGGTIGAGRNQHRIYFYDAEKRWISRTPTQEITENSFTTPANCKYIQVQVVVAVESTTDWMLNEGPTPLPYEPYGYKLPIVSGGITTNVYLGEVQSTRKIKKLVFTGNERWGRGVASSGYRFSIGINDGVQSDTTVGIKSYCSHFQIVGTGATYTKTNSYVISADLAFICRIDSSYTLESFKQWLADQYAAGTPVTIWYVLDEPTTGIVNEPIRKIGDYVDTITNPVPIPTTTGSQTFNVTTTLKPSEVDLSYHGWHKCRDIHKYKIIDRVLTNLPDTIIGDGNNMLSYTIKGNMTQNGTPTPSAPIYPSECGERTDNLSTQNYTQRGLNWSDGTISNTVMTNRLTTMDFSDIISGQVTAAVYDANSNSYDGVLLEYDSNGNYTGNYQAWHSLPYTWTVGANTKVRLCVKRSDISNIDADNTKIMLNTGSTPKPYEPYGYKLPVVSGGVTTNVYLGEVQSTRRIKKLVFTGKETWSKNTGSSNNYLYYISYPTILPLAVEKSDILCTHFIEQRYPPVDAIGVNTKNNYNQLYVNFGEILNSQPLGNTPGGVKQFLTAQYAAGTPVTIWYVLATETTGIVNEPICKINNYVDTVTNPVPIPTTGTSETFNVATTLKPSEVDLSYHSWYDIYPYGTIGYLQTTYTVGQMQQYPIDELQGGD